MNIWASSMWRPARSKKRRSTSRCCASSVPRDVRSSRTSKRPSTRPPRRRNETAPPMLPVMDAAALAGRVLLAAIFLHEAWSKLTGYAAASAYMSAYGVPELLLAPAISVELVGGVLIAVGYHTRAAALALAAFCVATAVLFHSKLGDRNQLLHFEKDLAIAGGFLVLFARGAGAWALDAFATRRGE